MINVLPLGGGTLVVLTLPMCFACQIDHQFCSKWLLNEMYSLGYCKSWNEILNYKCYYIHSNFKLIFASSNTLETIHKGEEAEPRLTRSCKYLLITRKRPNRQTQTHLQHLNWSKMVYSTSVKTSICISTVFVSQWVSQLQNT